jgi:predicted heme/steroid binding protein
MRRSLTAATVLVIVAALMGLAACGGGGALTTEPPTQVTEAVTTTVTGAVTTAVTDTTTAGRTFTLDELAQFDGKDGRPAYVAVDGVVYDVSGSRMWPDGEHTRCDFGAVAGQDLSEVITKAPANMRSLLEKMPLVGTLQ